MAAVAGKRHRWNYQVPHFAICENCGIHRRQVWYPGGHGASAYYTPAGVYISSRAPACEPATPERSVP